MHRRYFISNDLQDLGILEKELIAAGIEPPQIHIYTHNDSGAENLQLHDVSSFTKRDVVRSGLIGMGLGMLAAVSVLLVAQTMGWVQSDVGWMPFIFLAIVLLGFITWEGGLRGIQEPNNEFLPFTNALAQGKHIFYVDIDADQAEMVTEIIARHPQLEAAGDGASTPSWLVYGQANFQRFIKAMP